MATELDKSYASKLLELKSSDRKGLEVYVRPVPRASLLSDKEKKDARDAFAADEAERERNEAGSEAARQLER